MSAVADTLVSASHAGLVDSLPLGGSATAASSQAFREGAGAEQTPRRAGVQSAEPPYRAGYGKSGLNHS